MMSQTVPPVRRLPAPPVPPSGGYAIHRGSATSPYHIAARRTFRPSGRQTECGSPCLAEGFRPPAFLPTQPRSHTRTDHGSQRRCRRFPAGEIRVLPALSPFGFPPERLARARIASMSHATCLTGRLCSQPVGADFGGPKIQSGSPTNDDRASSTSQATEGP